MGKSWWPHWAPAGITVDSFVRFFRGMRFELCSDGSPEEGFEKVAIYAIGSRPTHVARQLAPGRWTSKLGKSFDIEHVIEALEGDEYGSVACYLKRRRPSGPLS
jgi:hypothetical protein